MWMNIRKMRYLPLIATLALAACGGDNGGTGSVSALSAAGAPSAASTPAATTAPTASNVDKSARPVELPDTVTPVNYRLWFRPNDALNAFDGRADVEIKVLKPVTSIVVAGHRIKFTNGRITLQPGNVQLIATPQD
jgi:aminopeptidase N